MSDDIKSGMLGEGETTAHRSNESFEDLPTGSNGEGDVSGPRDRVNISSGAGQPAAETDSDIEHVSRTATNPSVEIEARDDSASPGKAP